MTNLDLVLAQAFELPTFQPEWEGQLLAALERLEGSVVRDLRPFPCVTYEERPLPRRCHV